MAESCILPHISSATNSREVLVKRGVIESIEGSNRILRVGEFDRAVQYLNNSARVNYGVTDPLYTKEQRGTDYFIKPNPEAFAKIDAKRKEFGIYDTKESIGSYNSRQPKSFLQRSEINEPSVSPKTVTVVKNFLKQIGVSIENVNEIVVDGIKMNANGAALVTQKLIQLLNGKESVALPEEAMHFAVEIIKQKDPALFNQLLKEINDSQIYKSVLADYSSDPLYQTKEGKPDILKLKTEAIGKALAERVIGKTQDVTETPTFLARVEAWWNKILDSLKGIFLKSGLDQAAMDIISGKFAGTADDIRAEEASTYLQKTGDAQTDVYNALTSMAKRMVPAKDGGNYMVDGTKEVKTRVSDLVHDFYSRRFKANELTKGDYEAAVDSVKQETGTAFHADIDHMMKHVFLDDNGFMREEEGNDSEYVSQMNPENRAAYDTLKYNLRQRLISLGGLEGTRFLSETMVYNPKYGNRDIAGTIDFIAIKKNGKLSILDWKFMDLNTERYTDVPWYKVAAWQIQMDTYKTILAKAYGIDPALFEQTRMIPVKVHYTPGNKELNVLPKLDRIEIGDVNVANIQQDYLIPVGIESETTGSAKIDKLLKQLMTDYKILSEKPAIGYGEKASKAEQLNALYSAIRKLQMQKDIIPLIYQAKVLNQHIDRLMDRYKTDWIGTDPMSYSDDALSTFATDLSNYQSSLQTYLSLDIALKELFKGELTEQQKEIRSELRDVVDEARYLDEDLKQLSIDFNRDFNTKRENVGDQSLPEKVIKGFSRIFSSTALLQTRGIQAFFEKSNRALTKAAQDTIDESRKLETLEKAYAKMAQSKGLNKKNYFDLIKKKDSNELIDEFNPEFYSTLKDKIEVKDFTWIRDNVDDEKLKELLDERRKIEFERIENKPRPTLTPEQINDMITREKSAVIKELDITSAKGAGWLQYDLVKQNPLRSAWESNDFKELNKKGNEAALDFYNYIIERNNEYRSVGYLSKQDSARVFLPYIKRGMLENLAFGGNLTLGESFLSAISVDSENIGFGKYDARTGQLVNSIPVYFTTKLAEGQQVSTELFRNMALYNEMAIKFKYMSEIEGQCLQLLAIERAKGAINTSIFNKTKYKDGKVEYIQDNSKNAKLLESMINSILYGQKYLQDESFDAVLGKVGTWAESINKKLGIKIFPEGLAERQISLNKTVAGINRYFQMKTLGLSFLAPMSNFLGGNLQAMINAGRYFDKSDLMSAQAFLASKMAGVKSEEIQKFMGAFDYFLPFTENFNREVAKGLALNKLNGETLQDGLMYLMRHSDKNVQATLFKAFISNAIIQDGQVQNVREYLRNTDEYKDMYKGTSAEREERKAKFEKDAKQLLEDKALLKLATIEDGKFVIPGIERSSDNIIKLRTQIQQMTNDALGQLPESQKRMLNMTIYGDSFAMFKNWVPRLVDVRFGNLKYNSASDAWEFGRMRTFARELTNRQFYTMSNLKALLSGNVSDEGINRMREDFEKKKADYERETGKTFDMTETQFMDMYKQNVKNSLIDVIATSLALSAFLALKAEPPDPNEDVRVKNTYKFMLRAADKFTDELFYFYNPANFTQLITGGIFPSIKLITDFEKLLANFMKYNYGVITGASDGEMKNIHVIKYLLKTFPGSNQIEQYLPMALPDVAKNLGIQPQSSSGFSR